MARLEDKKAIRLKCRVCGYLLISAQGPQKAWERLRDHFFAEHESEAVDLFKRLDSTFTEAVSTLPHHLQDSALIQRDDDDEWETEQ